MHEHVINKHFIHRRNVVFSAWTVWCVPQYAAYRTITGIFWKSSHLLRRQKGKCFACALPLKWVLRLKSSLLADGTQRTLLARRKGECTVYETVLTALIQIKKRTTCHFFLIGKKFFLFYRSQVLADWASHPSLLISDDEEEPPVLSPQKPTKDLNGNLLKDDDQPEQDPLKAHNMDSEIKNLLNGVAKRLMPEAVGLVPTKSSSRSKAMEFSAKLMGLPIPEVANQVKAWTEHPILKLSREEVNSRFSEMPYGLDSEKRLGCPPPSLAAKVQTIAATDTLSGADMGKLPHGLRTEIPKGAKIETVELKSKLPRAVEEESSALLWNSVRNSNKFHTNLCFNDWVSSQNWIHFNFALVTIICITDLYSA